MRSKKEWLKWFDSLNEDELAKVIEQKNSLLKTPAAYDKDILNFIKNPQKEAIKKSELFEKIKKLFYDKPAFGYALSFASLLVILTLSILPFIKTGTLNKTIITAAENSVYLTDAKNNRIMVRVNDVINEKSSVTTEKSASASISIGNSANITLKEETSILFNELYKKKGIIASAMLLKNGESHFVVNKLNDLSSFKVETDTIIIEVAGTEFIVTVNDNKNTRVEVKEGRLLISAKINPENEIKNIRRIDKDFSTEIDSIIKEKFILEKGQILEVSFNDFNESKNEISGITGNISNEISTAKRDKQKIKVIKFRSRPRLEQIRKARKNIFKLKNKIVENNNLNNNQKEEKELRYISKKIGGLPGTKLTEKNTSITTDGRQIYITSDSNVAVFCINPVNGKLLWSYKDPLLTDLTSPVINYKNKIVLPAFNKIFILEEKSGGIFSIVDIDKGSNYWAEAKIYNEKLFIPTSSGITTYDNTSFNKLENLDKVLGQLYITIQDNKIYYLDSNEQTLKMYNLSSNSIEWRSDKFENRSFGTPLVIENQIYVTDYKSSIYRFNLNTKNSLPDLINMETGVISNLVNYKNDIYFVANNGNLYSIDIDKFDKAKKIIEVDKAPNYNIYLTKKLLLVENDLYFSSNTGDFFHYDLNTNIGEFIVIEANRDKFSLVASPVKIEKDIYLIDTEANIYKISKTFE